jgi:hypothetical protein
MTDKWIRLYNALFITLQNITRNAAPPTFKFSVSRYTKGKGAVDTNCRSVPCVKKVGEAGACYSNASPHSTVINFYRPPKIRPRNSDSLRPTFYVAEHFQVSFAET